MYCPNEQCPDVLQWGIHGEYRDGITICPKCGMTLVQERPQPEIAEGFEKPVTPQLPPVPGPLVTLAAFNYRHDADLAVSMLLANGISAVVAADDCGTLDPALGFGTRSRVLVDASQVEAASGLLEQAVVEGEPGGA